MRLTFHPFFKDTVIYGLARGLHAAVFFIAIFVLTRHLSPADYGRAALFQAAVLFMVPFLEFTVLIQRVYHLRGGEDFSRTMKGAFVASSFRSLQVLGVLAVAGWWLAGMIGFDTVWLFVALGVALVQVWFTLCHGYWQASRQLASRAVTWVASSLLYLLLVYVFVTVWPLGWLAPVAALVLSAVVMAGVGMALIWRPLAFSTVPMDWATARNLLAKQRPLLTHQVSAAFYLSAGQLILASYLPLNDIGMVALAMQCASIVNIYADSVMPAFIPWIHMCLKAPSRKEWKTIVMISACYLAVLLVLAVGTALLAQWIIGFMAGAAYGQAALYVPWICMAFFFQGIVKLLTPYVLFHPSWFGRMSTVTVVSLLVYLLLMFTLVQSHGIKGAMMALFLGFVFRALLMVGLACRVCRAGGEPE